MFVLNSDGYRFNNQNRFSKVVKWHTRMYAREIPTERWGRGDTATMTQNQATKMSKNAS